MKKISFKFQTALYKFFYKISTPKLSFFVIFTI
jgi:hypothetical protein